VAHRFGDGKQDLSVRGVELTGLIRAGESLQERVEPTSDVLGQPAGSSSAPRLCGCP
jgi:hypothetical protein